MGSERAGGEPGQLPGPGGPLTVTTTEVADPGHLLARLPGPAALAWVRRGEGLAGWGEVTRLVLPAGADRFTAGRKWLRELFHDMRVHDEVQVPGTGPVAFGSFTFDPVCDGSVLTVPRVILARRCGRAWLTTVTGPGEAIPAGAARQALTAPRVAPVAVPAEVRWSDGSLSAPQWEQAVAAAVTQIRAGELSKVVLARDLLAVASGPVDPRMITARLAARYPDCYTFSVAGLVGATPELYVRRERDRVSSLVLAGTAPRGGTAAQDEAIGAALLASAKNVEEHGYAVADVRAALEPRCAELTVAGAPSLLRLANVQHLATPVTGVLSARPGGELPSALALAAVLHPTPAVCGTPTAAAMQMIRELERMDRDRYAGPVGWVDAAGNGEWGIALRCAALDGRRARLFAGCGIVADSDPAAELAEAQAKFRPVQQAIES